MQNERREHRSFEILQFQLTNDFVAVYADKAEDGFVDLDAIPVQAIGLAKLTTKYLERTSEKAKWEEWSEPEFRNEMVGLELDEGSWHVSNESENFAGICKSGSDITKAIGELIGKYHGKFRCREQEVISPFESE
jgi:hypothetical protein